MQRGGCCSEQVREGPALDRSACNSVRSWRAGEAVQEARTESLRLLQLRRDATALLSAASANLTDGATEEALAAVEGARLLFRQAGMRAAEADASFRRALLMDHLGRARSECVAAANEALALAADAPKPRCGRDGRALAGACRALARAQLLVGDADLAGQLAERAAASFHVLGDGRAQAAALLTLARARFLGRRAPDALQAAGAARTLCLRSGDARGDEAARLLLGGPGFAEGRIAGIGGAVASAPSLPPTCAD